MLIPDTPTVDEPILPIHRRAPSIVLPEDPSQEELVQYWTLSTRDKEGSCMATVLLIRLSPKCGKIRPLIT